MIFFLFSSPVSNSHQRLTGDFATARHKTQDANLIQIHTFFFSRRDLLNTSKLMSFYEKELERWARGLWLSSSSNAHRRENSEHWLTVLIVTSPLVVVVRSSIDPNVIDILPPYKSNDNFMQQSLFFPSAHPANRDSRKILFDFINFMITLKIPKRQRFDITMMSHD